MDLKNILSVTTAKQNLMKLLKEVQEMGSTFVITKDGKAAGVLMSSEEYEGLMETIEILGDPKILKSLQKAKQEFEQGHFYTEEEVFDS